MNMCGKLAAVSVAVALVLGVASASADAPPASMGRPFGTDDDPPPGVPAPRERVVMRLAYTAAGGCPDDQVVRAAIGAQVRRWDPFAPNAPWRLDVSIGRRRGGGYEGSAELRDVMGTVKWARPLAPQARCFDLVEDLAVMLALHINPPSPPQPQRPEQSLPLPLPPPPPEQGSKLPEPLRKPSRVALRVGMGTWMNLATSPRPAFGMTADVGIRASWFSVAGELRWDPPAGTTMDGWGVSTALVAGALVPCGHVQWFVGCVVGELGQFRGSVSGASPEYQGTLYGAVGARIGFEIPVVPERLYVRLAANLLGAPVRPRLLVTYPDQDPQIAWESASFTGGFGAGLVASF